MEYLAVKANHSELIGQALGETRADQTATAGNENRLGHGIHRRIRLVAFRFPDSLLTISLD